jgi:hypothetical protein
MCQSPCISSDATRTVLPRRVAPKTLRLAPALRRYSPDPSRGHTIGGRARRVTVDANAPVRSIGTFAPSQIFASAGVNCSLLVSDDRMLGSLVLAVAALASPCPALINLGGLRAALGWEPAAGGLPANVLAALQPAPEAWQVALSRNPSNSIVVDHCRLTNLSSAACADKFLTADPFAWFAARQARANCLEKAADRKEETAKLFAFFDVDPRDTAAAAGSWARYYKEQWTMTPDGTTRILINDIDPADRVVAIKAAQRQYVEWSRFALHMAMDVESPGVANGAGGARVGTEEKALDAAAREMVVQAATDAGLSAGLAKPEDFTDGHGVCYSNSELCTAADGSSYPNKHFSACSQAEEAETSFDQDINPNSIPNGSRPPIPSEGKSTGYNGSDRQDPEFAECVRQEEQRLTRTFQTTVFAAAVQRDSFETEGEQPSAPALVSSRFCEIATFSEGFDCEEWLRQLGLTVVTPDLREQGELMDTFARQHGACTPANSASQLGPCQIARQQLLTRFELSPDVSRMFDARQPGTAGPIKQVVRFKPMEDGPGASSSTISKETPTDTVIQSQRHATGSPSNRLAAHRNGASHRSSATRQRRPQSPSRASVCQTESASNHRPGLARAPIFPTRSRPPERSAQATTRAPPSPSFRSNPFSESRALHARFACRTALAALSRFLPPPLGSPRSAHGPLSGSQPRPSAAIPQNLGSVTRHSRFQQRPLAVTPPSPGRITQRQRLHPFASLVTQCHSRSCASWRPACQPPSSPSTHASWQPN